MKRSDTSAIIAWLVVSCLVGGCGCDGTVSPGQQHADTQVAPPDRLDEKRAHTAFEFDPGLRATEEPLDQRSAAEFRRVSFTDVAQNIGLDFTYSNGAYGKELMVESLGGGCCWFDYDSDGWPDLFLPQGGRPDAADPTQRPPDMLFRNDRGRTFESVTHARVAGVGYGQGAATGDFDGDGFDDIYVTNVGRNFLYRNQGDGTFVEVTDTAGVGDPRWSTSAAWADLNGDGRLDLYVCNYADYDPHAPIVCAKDGVPALCHPRQVPPVPDECYLNLGDGRFEAAATRLGLFGEGNRGLGVVAADLDNTGSVDLYVCNDTTANFLFLSQPTGTFRESALVSGAAVNANGYAQASMGIAVGDYDNNQALDLYLTHFTHEENALYQNLGDHGQFREVAGLSGMREISYTKLGFGTVMRDLNFDGSMDLFVANGHIDSQHADGDGYEQNPQLMSFDGYRWVEVSEFSGEYFQQKLVGRGVAAADYDRDGDVDLAVVHQNAPMALLRNDSERGSSVVMNFVGEASARDGINVRAWVECGKGKRMQELSAGTSYCATHYPELIFPALGSENCAVTVLWPTGRKHAYQDVAPGEAITFFESGKLLREQSQAQ